MMLPACHPTCRPHFPGFDAVGKTWTCPSCKRTWEVVKKHVDVYWRLKQ